MSLVLDMLIRIVLLYICYTVLCVWNSEWILYVTYLYDPREFRVLLHTRPKLGSQALLCSSLCLKLAPTRSAGNLRFLVFSTVAGGTNGSIIIIQSRHRMKVHNDADRKWCNSIWSWVLNIIVLVSALTRCSWCLLHHQSKCFGKNPGLWVL